MVETAMETTVDGDDLDGNDGDDCGTAVARVLLR